MNRRGYLTGLAAGGTLAVAGCLERLGFEEESAWRDPPLVEDRPAAVYVPPAIEEMGEYGRASAGPYEVALTYTVPHRFWLVSGETERVEITADDTHHLMCHVWDPETHTVLPTAISVELTHPDGGHSEFTPWPMISQRMGFHYGDNIELPEEGSYEATITVGPLEVTGRGAMEDRFDDVASATVSFEYDHDDIHDLSFDILDEAEWGRRDALEPMHHDGHDGHGHDHPPMSMGPAIDELPGTHLGTDRSADARIALNQRQVDEGTELVCTLRTPYNDVTLPFASIEATVGLEDESTVYTLSERLDAEAGHYYGASIERPLESGEELSLHVRSPPAVSRHAGYETAFLEFGDVTLTV